MKKVKLILSVCLAACSLNMFAQFSNSSKSSTSVSSDGWNTIYLQWNPSHLSPNKGDSQSFNGFSIGYNHAFSLTQSIPLYLETGLGFQYSTYKEDGEFIFYDPYDDDTYYLDGSQKFNMFSFKVPLHVLYKFDITNSPISIEPYAGLNMRFNLSAKMKISDLEDDYYEYDYEEDIDLFDKKDMGSSSATWKRFQVGWEIGARVKYNNKLSLGVSYGQDFSEIAKKTHIHTTTLSLGYCF